MNPVTLIDLEMTHNVTIYHCNMIGTYNGYSVGGYAGYTPTNIRLDNGYPDGGNYYERLTKIDNYSGPNQDILGADGICDQPRSFFDIGVDRYPLVEPFVWEQATSTDDGWNDTILWLSIIGIIVIASSLISYVLFLRERPSDSHQRKEEKNHE